MLGRLGIKQATTLQGALTKIAWMKDENAFQWNHGRNIFATVVFSPREWVFPQCLIPMVRANKLFFGVLPPFGSGTL
jgi:hypothetical protein